jgi:hypothetical protein
MNVEIRTKAAQIPRKGLHKWDFCCSVSTAVITRACLLSILEWVPLTIVRIYEHVFLFPEFFNTVSMLC